MEPQTKSTAKDIFINLGAIVSLGMVVGNLISLLFTIINKAYPVTTGYNYYTSYSISWPVATLIIFFPIYILLMWFLEKDYKMQPEKRNMGIRKWLTFITLFLAGLAIAGDLVTVLYYFIDGRDLTAGFIMKIVSVLVVAVAVFFYYISDAMGKLNAVSRKVWTGAAFIVILGSVIWGFSVLGSPRTQQLLRYDEQKINSIISLDSQVRYYYGNKGVLPSNLSELSSSGNYYVPESDPQTGKPYEYIKTSNTTYDLCAEFNVASNKSNTYFPTANQFGPDSTWLHPAGRFCFTESVNPNMQYTAPGKPIPAY